MLKKNRRQSRNALFVIASLFLMSGVLRFGSGTGLAIAEELEARSESDSALNPEICAPNEGIALLLSELSEREDRVEGNELAIKNRLVTLEVAEEKYQQTLERLIAAENALSATISKASIASESDLAQLTAMYENMKPKDAAALFEEMDPVFSSGFLGRMRPDAAALVLAGLRPKTAYAISVILAGRNEQVPKDDL